MEFTKMHGLGNDYICLNCMERFPEDPEKLAAELSKRHFGIGADGLICVCPSDTADFSMRMFNADGSEGAMCGNGIRCAAKYVIDKKLTGKRELRFETGAGLRNVTLQTMQGDTAFATVDMGRPIVEETLDIHVKGKTYTGIKVSMGNPHFVIWLTEIEQLELNQLGPEIENSPYFMGGVNIEFVKIVCRKEIRVRVWERGSGETLACGTGACAAVAALYTWGAIERRATVYMPGGAAEVYGEKTGDHLFLSGPAVTVFEGRI